MQFFGMLIIVKEALKQNRKRKIDNKTKVAAVCDYRCVIQNAENKITNDIFNLAPFGTNSRASSGRDQQSSELVD